MLCRPRTPSAHRRGAWRAALLVSAALIGGSAAAADELPLTRVVLSSAGLAQFTHSGPVSAGTTVELAVRLDQVDDILKSMTVFDEELKTAWPKLSPETQTALRERYLQARLKYLLKTGESAEKAERDDLGHVRGAC